MPLWLSKRCLAGPLDVTSQCQGHILFRTATLSTLLKSSQYANPGPQPKSDLDLDYQDIVSLMVTIKTSEPLRERNPAQKLVGNVPLVPGEQAELQTQGPSASQQVSQGGESPAH